MVAVDVRLVNDSIERCLSVKVKYEFSI